MTNKVGQAHTKAHKERIGGWIRMQNDRIAGDREGTTQVQNTNTNTNTRTQMHKYKHRHGNTNA